jgi:hypothetical protein
LSNLSKLNYPLCMNDYMQEAEIALCIISIKKHLQQMTLNISACEYLLGSFTPGRVMKTLLPSSSGSGKGKK